MSGGGMDIARAVVDLGPVAGKSFDLELPSFVSNSMRAGTMLDLLSTFGD
jgi:hypothetical protein